MIYILFLKKQSKFIVIVAIPAIFSVNFFYGDGILNKRGLSLVLAFMGGLCRAVCKDFFQNLPASFKHTVLHSYYCFYRIGVKIHLKFFIII